MKEAMLYDKLDDCSAHCRMCPHECVIKPGGRGRCGVRKNTGGTLYAETFGKAIACSADPVEKKPFYHFLPGSTSLSVASAGCNLRCPFCQNYDISQAGAGAVRSFDLPPGQIVAAAAAQGCESISYTYTEPTVFMEYALETAGLARKQGLKNTLVTNGYMSREALKLAGPYIDAANIDLKSMNEEFYRMCSGSLEPVLETIRAMKKAGIWIELTTLIIPTLNDSPGELSQIAGFIREIGEDTPWHVSGFYPAHRMSNFPPTPRSKVEEAAGAGLDAGLKYVYTGNIPGGKFSDTLCPSCGGAVIRRRGYSVSGYNITDSSCGFCGCAIDGIFT